MLLENRERTGLFSSMVFRTVPETEPNTNNNTAMASSTSTTTNVKPHQPLHNFPLQDLKWSMNHSNNVTNHHHRFRTHKSPHRDVASAADSDEDGGVKIKKLLKIKSGDVDNSERKSKIFIRLRTNKNCSGSSSSKCMVDGVAADAGDLDSAAVVEDVEESIPKTWNLRPRRAVNNINNDSNSNNKGLNGNGGALKIGGGAVPEIKPQVPGGNRTELTRSNRNGHDVNNYDNDNDNDNNNNNKKEKGKGKEKEKKVRFSIPLTKVEIEEDIYSLTGSKPARRPKKRAKHVQKNLDVCCYYFSFFFISVF